MNQNISNKHLARTEKHKLKKEALKNKYFFKKLKTIGYNTGCILYIIGIITSFYSYRNFDYSIMQFKNYSIIYIISGLTISILLNILTQDKKSFFSTIVFNTFWFGSIPLALIFFINKEFSTSKPHFQTYEIYSKYIPTHIGNKSPNSVKILYNDFYQEVKLPNKEKEEVEKADSIELELNVGKLGIIFFKTKNLK